MNDIPQNWFCRTFGIELGPMPLETVRKLIHDAELTPNDEVRRGESGPWLPAKAVAELSAELQCRPRDNGIHSDQKTLPSSNLAVGQQLPQPTVPISPLPDTQLKPLPLEAIPVLGSSAPSPIHSENNAPRSPQSESRVHNSPSMEQWFCHIAGVEYGPARFQHLQATIAIGRLAPDDYVKKGRDGTWLPVRSIPALMGVAETIPSGHKTDSVSSHSIQSVSPHAVSHVTHLAHLPKKDGFVSSWAWPRWALTCVEFFEICLTFLGAYFQIIAAVSVWIAINIIVIYYPTEGKEACLMILQWLKSPTVWVWTIVAAAYIGAVVLKFRSS